jgi:hypothetical protein
VLALEHDHDRPAVRFDRAAQVPSERERSRPRCDLVGDDRVGALAKSDPGALLAVLRLQERHGLAEPTFDAPDRDPQQVS